MGATSRPSTGSSTVSNSRRMRENGIFVGIVKNVVDPQKMGRIAVWVPEMGGPPDTPSSWITVGYASPFAGATNVDATIRGSTQEAGTQSSYGMWMNMPDVGNEVLVCFCNGDTSRGFWFACVWQQNMNHMVPGIACNSTTDPTLKASGAVAPTAEYNKQAVQNTTNPSRPAFAPLTEGLISQGLTTDYERGPGSTSARRESPSKAFGISTPRGNSFSMDDNEKNEMIRIRTRSGTQILVHETGGYVYICSKAGNSWLELSDAGIDVYSSAAISMRAGGDFNIRADGNINLDAGGMVNIASGTDTTLTSGASIQIGAPTKSIVMSTGGLFTLAASDGIKAQSGASINLGASGDVTVLASGNIVRTASAIVDNGSNAAVMPQADPAQGPIPKPQPDSTGGTSTTTSTIVSRMPAHEPWSGHPKSNLPPSSDGPSASDVANRAPAGSTPATRSVTPMTNVQCGEGTRNVPTIAGNPCSLGVGTKGASDESFNAIKTASAAKSVPFGGMMAIADVSSGFDPHNTVSGIGSSSGLFQFDPASWTSMVKNYGARDNVSHTDVFHPLSNALMGANQFVESVTHLVSQGIKNPTTGMVYMARMFGPAIASGFISAARSNPTAPLSSVLTPAQIAANPTWLQGKTTVGDAFNHIDGTMNAKAASYAPQVDAQGPCARPAAGATPLPAGVASLVAKYNGQSVGSGQCVALVQQGSGLPNTARWSQGTDITPDNCTAIPPGTPIATFQNGRYGNNTNGSSHAAYFIGPGTTPSGQPGITIFDQWSGSPARTRVIPFNRGGAAANNGSAFSVINV